MKFGDLSALTPLLKVKPFSLVSHCLSFCKSEKDRGGCVEDGLHFFFLSFFFRMLTQSRIEISMEVLEGVGPVLHAELPAHEREPEVQGHPVAGGQPDGDRGDCVVPMVGVVEHLDVPALLAESIQLVRAANPVDHTPGGGSGGRSDRGPEHSEDFVPREGENKGPCTSCPPRWRCESWCQ